MNYIPGFRETYDGELASIEAAAESVAAYVQRETAKLSRSDGSPVFGPAEHAERHAAILQAAGDQFDRAVARHLDRAARTVADLTRFTHLTEASHGVEASRWHLLGEDLDRLHRMAVAARGSWAGA